MGKHVLAFICTLIAFVSCRTPIIVQSVTETDTLVIVSHDTIGHVTTQRETIIQKDSTHTQVVIAPNGKDTLKYIETRYIYNTEMRETIDSLHREIARLISEVKTDNKTEVVTEDRKKPPEWFYIMVISAIIALIIKYMRARAQ